MAIFSVGAFAQFEMDTKYVNISLSGLNMSYSKNEKFNLGLNAMAGYFLDDDVMLYGRFNYEYSYHLGDNHAWALEAGSRYYIRQNGLYLGLGLKYGYNYSYDEISTSTPGGDPATAWRRSSHNNLYLTPEVGYCFYLNHYLSIEPALYYDMSLNHFSDFSKVGFRIGAGFYF